MEDEDVNLSSGSNELLSEGSYAERKQMHNSQSSAEGSDDSDFVLPVECILEVNDEGRVEIASDLSSDLSSDILSDVSEPDEEKVIFKKPSLALGPIRGKVADSPNNGSSSKVTGDKPVSSKTVSTGQSEKKPVNLPFPYTEPAWSGYPSRVYKFEVIKEGKIIEMFDLSTRSYNAIGRSPDSDIVLLHPTISRYHAIIQFRDDDKGTPENPPGMYLYDMGSTHGTFLNKNRVKQKMYIRIHVGHILKFGASTRHFVLHGPQEEEEEESLLSVTQIQSQRSNELIRRKLDEIKGKVPEEEQGISWGMDDDADEETDLAINPFALTTNEELYVDDPKKTLRGWFEREGHDLTYNVEEKSSGQFRCFIEIPVESCRGGIHVAEAVVKGKKKEAVLQCALEACRVLDQYGLLRQATHESKKRKAKDWEADDYYDSDDDTFLDRTGTVEKKRKARMEAHTEKQALTYQDLLKKREDVMAEVQEAESRFIESNKKKLRIVPSAQSAQDELDAYMNSLQECPDQQDKALLSQLKIRIQELKAEAERLRLLINRARPLGVPELESDSPSAAEPVSRANVLKRMSEINRKARALMKQRKVTTGIPASTKMSAKPPETKRTLTEMMDDECEYEVESSGSPNSKSSGDVTSTKYDLVRPLVNSKGMISSEQNRTSDDTFASATEDEIHQVKSDGSEEMFLRSSGYETGSEVMGNLTAEEDCVKLEKPNEGHTKEGSKIMKKKDGCDPGTEKHEADKAVIRTDEHEEGLGPDEVDNEKQDKEEEKKKKRNKKRNMQRNAKSQKEKHARWTGSDGPPELFSDWTPPQGQSGDGRTSLNDKLGY